MNESIPQGLNDFIDQNLSPTERAQIVEQFKETCIPNKQVLWTGILREEAQAWADAHHMQTLTTAMGPLMDNSQPHCPLNRKNPRQGISYIHGASALFALHIAEGESVTVLCAPPPQRFHPSGRVSFQDIEEPILKGELGTRPVKRINAVHPLITSSSDFTYQMWPADEVSRWIERFGAQVFEVKWRAVKQKPDPLLIEICRRKAMGSESASAKNIQCRQDTAIRSTLKKETEKPGISSQKSSSPVTLAEDIQRTLLEVKARHKQQIRTLNRETHDRHVVVLKKKQQELESLRQTHITALYGINNDLDNNSSKKKAKIDKQLRKRFEHEIQVRRMKYGEQKREICKSAAEQMKGLLEKQAKDLKQITSAERKAKKVCKQMTLSHAQPSKPPTPMPKPSPLPSQTPSSSDNIVKSESQTKTSTDTPTPRPILWSEIWNVSFNAFKEILHLFHYV